MYLIVLSGKPMEGKSLLQPPFLHSRHAVTQRAGHELLLHTFVLVVAGTFAVLGKGHLLVIQPPVISTMAKLYCGSSGMNLQILPVSPFLVHFLPFYEVGGMM